MRKIPMLASVFALSLSLAAHKTPQRMTDQRPTNLLPSDVGFDTESKAVFESYTVQRGTVRDLTAIYISSQNPKTDLVVARGVPVKTLADAQQAARRLAPAAEWRLPTVADLDVLYHRLDSKTFSEFLTPAPSASQTTDYLVWVNEEAFSNPIEKEEETLIARFNTETLAPTTLASTVTSLGDESKCLTEENAKHPFFRTRYETELARAREEVRKLEMWVGEMLAALRETEKDNERKELEASLGLESKRNRLKRLEDRDYSVLMAELKTETLSANRGLTDQLSAGVAPLLFYGRSPKPEPDAEPTYYAASPSVPTAIPPVAGEVP